MLTGQFTKTFDSSDTTATLAGSVPPNSYILRIYAIVDTAFETGDVVDVGDGTTANKYADDIALSSVGNIAGTLEDDAIGVLDADNSTEIYLTVVNNATASTDGSGTLVVEYAQK